MSDRTGPELTEIGVFLVQPTGKVVAERPPPAPGRRMNTGGGELTQSLSVAVVSHSMMSADDLSDPPSSPDSPFDDSDLLSSSTVADDVTTQLAAAGQCILFTLSV